MIRPQTLASLTALLLIVGCQPPAGDAKKTATKKADIKVEAKATDTKPDAKPTGAPDPVAKEFVDQVDHSLRTLLVAASKAEWEKNTNITDQVVEYFKTIPDFSIGITPEGTRKQVKSWKTGFWRIAKGANVPLILTSFDYGRREVTFREPFRVTDDMDQDIAWMTSYFARFSGKNRPARTT